MAPAKDVLLSSIAKYLIRLVDHLEASLAHGTQQLPPLTHELIRLRWRSDDMLKDFGGYFCVRLVLDEQSPLALQFMDFFGELNWLLEGFEEEVARLLLATKDAALRAVQLGKILLDSLQTVVHTCCSLHCVYNMSRIKDEVLEFKRNAKPYRMFSKNPFQSNILARGFVNLDCCGGATVELDEQLAEGGFGIVYKGYFSKRNCCDPNSIHERVGDPVAVKMTRSTMLYNRCSSSENMQQVSESGNVTGTEQERALVESDNTSSIEHLMFTKMSNISRVIGSPNGLSEVLKLASFRHPNIVDVRGYIGRRKEYDFGIVMELMDMSLHDGLNAWLKEGVQLRELDMIDLMLEIAKGMRFLHERNVLHLDLKPGNVLLKHAERGVLEYVEVKLGDLGLTRCMTAEVDLAGRNTSALRGTSYYIAPELLMNGGIKAAKYTDKADVFSYGSTCFNIVKGDPNMRTCTNTNSKGFYKAIASGRWKEWVNGFPTRVVDLIDRCWQMQVSERPTFAEICLVLQDQKRWILAGNDVAPGQEQLFCRNIQDLRPPATLQGALDCQSGFSPTRLDDRCTDSTRSQHEKMHLQIELSSDESTSSEEDGSTWSLQLSYCSDASTSRRSDDSIRSSASESTGLKFWNILKEWSPVNLTPFESLVFCRLRDQNAALLQYSKVLMECSEEQRVETEREFFMTFEPRKENGMLKYLRRLPTEGREVETGKKLFEAIERINNTLRPYIGEENNNVFESSLIRVMLRDLCDRRNRVSFDGFRRRIKREMVQLLGIGNVRPYCYYIEKKIEVATKSKITKEFLEELSDLIRQGVLTASVYSKAQRMTAMRRAVREESWRCLCNGLEKEGVRNDVEETLKRMQETAYYNLSRCHPNAEVWNLTKGTVKNGRGWEFVRRLLQLMPRKKISEWISPSPQQGRLIPGYVAPALAICIWLALLYACAAATKKVSKVATASATLITVAWSHRRSEFQDDAARTPLQVDASVIPLLGGFDIAL